MKKLPKIITQEEFETLLKHTDNKEYRLAMLLGFEAGLRISEIVGFAKPKSRCCDAPAERAKGIWKASPRPYFCQKCGKQLTLKQIKRDKSMGWAVPPLTKENIFLDRHYIKIVSGKGKRDRIVPLPKRINEKAVAMLPISASRRALQWYVTELGKKLLQRGISFHCVDEDTEVLTLDGWKKYDQIKAGDEIFTYNLNKDIIEPKQLNDVYIHKYNGNMLHIKNKYVDSLVTPDHKIIARFSQRLKIRWNKYKDIWNSENWQLIPLNEILTNKSLRQIKYKLSASLDNNKSDTIGTAKAGILGWILSDGCISTKNRGVPDITIQQCITANKDKCEIISKLLSDNGLKYYIKVQKIKISDFGKKPYQMVIFRLSMPENQWIFDYVSKDRTPNLSAILRLNRAELTAIYQNMMLGDGANKKEYCGQNTSRIALIRILACFLSKRTFLGYKLQRGKTYFRTYITNRNKVDIHKHIKKETYDGIIWCPSTDNGTFLARRNDTIFLTSNTLRHGFATHLIKSGRPINEVQMFMGHSRMDVTAVYLHSDPQEAVNKARDIF